MKMSLGLEKRIELEMRGRPADQILDLNLDNCKATKIQGFNGEFTNLQTLSLINLGLQTLEGFPKLGNLKRLELSDNRISGGLNHLAGCPNLTHLSLSGNKIKNIDVLDGLKDLHFLRSLVLFNCEVTNSDQYREKVFDKLSQITFLDGFDKEEEQEEVDGEPPDLAPGIAHGEESWKQVKMMMRTWKELEMMACDRRTWHVFVEGLCSLGVEDEDDDEEDEDDDDDDDDEDEVGLSYLTKNIDDEDEDKEDFEPGEDGEEDDDHIVEGLDDEDEDGDGTEDDEESEDEDDGPRGTKRKHEEEEEENDDA